MPSSRLTKLIYSLIIASALTFEITDSVCRHAKQLFKLIDIKPEVDERIHDGLEINRMGKMMLRNPWQTGHTSYPGVPQTINCYYCNLFLGPAPNAAGSRPTQEDFIWAACSSSSFDYDIPPVCGQPGQVKCSTFEALRAARSVPFPSPRPDDALPKWLDLNLAARGQMFADKYIKATIIANIAGLVSFAASPEGVGGFLNTGLAIKAAGDTGKKVAISTLGQIQVWEFDSFNSSGSGGLQFPTDTQSSSMLASLKNLRQIHTASRKQTTEYFRQTGSFFNRNDFSSNYKNINKGLWNALRKDLRDSNIPAWQRQPPPSYERLQPSQTVPFNQQSFQLIMFPIVMYPAFKADKLGMETCDRDVFAFMHLWAGLAYALGVEDEFNIFLQPDMAAARKMANSIFDTYVVPALFNMDDTTIMFLDSSLHVSASKWLHPLQRLEGMAAVMFFFEQIVGIDIPFTIREAGPGGRYAFDTMKSDVQAYRQPSGRQKQNEKIMEEKVNSGGRKLFGDDFLSIPARADHVYCHNLDTLPRSQCSGYDDGPDYGPDIPDYTE